MIPCRSSIQRWQTTGLDSDFGIRQADTPCRGPPRPPPHEPSGETITPETVGGPGLDPCGRGGVSAGRKVRRARCLPACCEANRHRPAFPPFTSAFGPGLHLLSGGVGDGRTPWPSPTAVEWMVPGWADHSANAGTAFGKAPGPRHPRRSEGMSVRGRTMARGTGASRAGNGPWGPTPPACAGPPGAAARGSVETGRDLRAGPAQGGGGRNGGEELQPGRDRRRNPVPGAQGGGGRARHRYRMRPWAETGIIQFAATLQRPGAGLERTGNQPERAGPSRRPRTARTRFSGRRSTPGTGTDGADWAETAAPAPPGDEFRSE